MERKIREMEVWVAEVNGRAVGWVAIHGDYLEGLYTDPDFEKRGIGTQLLALAEQLVRQNGANTIRAEASRNSEEFYFRRGYEATGPRPGDGARPILKQLD
jgi:putative acetyltransferase